MSVPDGHELQTAAGWHGKLPTIGDFASRRLDADFIRVWDEWLSAGLAQLKAESGDGWLESYLTSPPWRFVLTPNFLPAPMHREIWAGVVMPSVDRVGRYYPLTIASKLPFLPGTTGVQAMLWSWLHRLEDLAVDALQDDWSIDTVEFELNRLGVPQWMAATALRDPAPLSAVAFFESGGMTSAGQWPAGCFWYSETEVLATRTLISPAMDRSVMRLWSGW